MVLEGSSSILLSIVALAHDATLTQRRRARGQASGSADRRQRSYYLAKDNQTTLLAKESWPTPMVNKQTQYFGSRASTNLHSQQQLKHLDIEF
jgi:hypothetical protein